jgi:hypothetical protein
MKIDINNAEAVAEIEQLMGRFGLSAETVVERVIIGAGCLMPTGILASPYWQDRISVVAVADEIPHWHWQVKKLPVFTKDWDLKIIHDPPHFELTHLSGFMVSLSVYDREAPLWQKAPGLILDLIKLRQGPTTRVPSGFSKTPGQRQALIKQARKDSC